MEWFFTYESDLPADVGFRMFGKAHLAWLLILAALTAAVSVYYVRSDKKRRRAARLLFGSLPVFLILVRTVYLCIVGYMTVYELPLHLCSLAGFIVLADAAVEKDWLRHTLWAAGLPGTLSALIFPDWVRYPAVSFISIEGFLFHGLLVLYPVMLFAAGELKISLRKFWQPVLFMLAMAVPVYIADRLLRANYMFLLVPSAGSPLIFIRNLFGDTGYLPGYILLVALVMAVTDGIGILLIKTFHKDRSNG